MDRGVGIHEDGLDHQVLRVRRVELGIFFVVPWVEVVRAQLGVVLWNDVVADPVRVLRVREVCEDTGERVGVFGVPVCADAVEGALGLLYV
jgi:hypothetical protein